MQCKVGKIDRVVIGAAILVLGLIFESWWGLLGILPLYTVTIAWCPKFLFCAMPSQKWWHQCCRGCC